MVHSPAGALASSGPRVDDEWTGVWTTKVDHEVIDNIEIRERVDLGGEKGRSPSRQSFPRPGQPRQPPSSGSTERRRGAPSASAQQHATRGAGPSSWGQRSGGALGA